ncbi:transcription initiation factor TFIID subunit 3-like [Engraulis encrasicolus]|uniref:transcription initiation factor TFIID subunit 3-like n=1 Tax=Engraulis encrasicolus TaxID=184585 RepID=UPI002FCFFE9B
MCDSYARSLLRVSVAQICQALGWDAVQLTACDLLSDVLDRYIQQLARGCHRYSELYGRTDPVLDDVGQAFKLFGINLNELEDYVHNLEPVGFAHQTPLFPVSKNNVLQFPQPDTRDKEERKEYIPDYMPPLVSLQEEEEEEESVLADMGTSAEAMQVPLDEDEDEEEEEEEAGEDVNDENHPLKRPMLSPDANMGMVPTSKRPRLSSGFSPEWAGEPREPLSSINPQRVPPSSSMMMMMDGMGSRASSSPEMPPLLPNPGFRPLPMMPRQADIKVSCAANRKPSVSSPGRQRARSPKGGSIGPSSAGSPICSPKAFSKEKRKSPAQAKSPKSPKTLSSSSSTSRPGLEKVPHMPGKSSDPLLQRAPLASLSERMGKENVHIRHMHNLESESRQQQQLGESPHLRKPEPPDHTIDDSIDDSIDAVIARACAERIEPDPFAYTSADSEDSESDSASSPRRLTISEAVTPKTAKLGASVAYDTSTPYSGSAVGGGGVPRGAWTMDDSIDEVIRRANQGSSSGTGLDSSYLSSGSESPPTPEPLMKLFEDKHNKLASVSADVKKKLKKELKTKLKKKEKEKPKEKEKERDKDKSKVKEKSRDKSRDKSKEPFHKEASKMPWKDFSLRGDEPREQHFKIRDLSLLPEMPPKSSKSKDAMESSFRKDKEKHRDKKKEKDKAKKDKDGKREKSKDRGKEEKKLSAAALTPFGQADAFSLFSPASCLRIPSMLPSLAPILPERDAGGKGSKEKDRKKDKKEKKKKKEKEKERERAKEKEREKEEKRKEREKEKEKEKREKEREREREKERERLKLEKMKMEPPAAVPSPVIPRLTLRVGGQDKIVISKANPDAAVPKPPQPKTQSAKAAHPLPPILSPAVPLLPPALLPPVLSAPVAPPPLPPALSHSATSSKAPVCSVVTETVSAYVVRDEWGNKIWICPGCNKPDDGSPMIGCDDCDDWYHWPCVGMTTAPPEDDQWFCVNCASKKKDKKHKKRKHKVH